MTAPAMTPAEKPKSGAPNITLPGGYMAEDGKGPGDEIQALVTLKLGDNGTADIISVDGSKYAVTEAPVEEVAEEEVVEEAVAPPLSFKDKAMMMS